jgi:hypothetical protein
MAAKLTKVTHNITIQLHLVAESCTICSSRSKRPVRKLLDIPSYIRQISIMCCYLHKMTKFLVRVYKIRKYLMLSKFGRHMYAGYLSLRTHRPLMHGKDRVPKIALRYYGIEFNTFKGVRCVHWLLASPSLSLSLSLSVFWNSLLYATQRHPRPLPIVVCFTRQVLSYHHQLS